MKSQDILIRGNKLSEGQKTTVLHTFKSRPNGMGTDTWLKTHSFWFSPDGRNLSRTKLYPQRNDFQVKDESFKVTYTLKANSLFNLSIINNKTGKKSIDVKSVAVDDMREMLQDMWPDYYGKIWSSIVMKVGAGKSDGYNTTGTFTYNSTGNEILKR